MDSKLTYKTFEIGQQIVEHTKYNKRDIVSYLSALIRFFTDSYWNHQLWVGGFYDDGTPKLYEAIDKGIVRLEPEDVEERLLGSDICILSPVKKLSKVQKARIEEISEQLVGVKYWFWGTLGLQLLQLIFGVWLGRKDNDIKSAKYCSHAGMFVLNLVTGFCRRAYKQSPKMTRRENCLHPVWSGIVQKVIK